LSVTIRKVTEKEQILAPSIDPDFIQALTKTNFKAFLGLGRVVFRTMKDEKRKPQVESTARKPPKQ
jgi:hypothetical protein